MTVRVALNHRTRYRYDRPVTLGPQVIRLRPAPHCRTPVTSYSLRVTPSDHYINWQQDPFGNFLARLVFQKSTREFEVEVDLHADMTVINPFDFFVEPDAEVYPFAYEPLLKKELGPYLATTELTPLVAELVESLPARVERSVDFLILLNRLISERVEYCVRMEPGVQTPEHTLEVARGSCRDSAWLLTHVLRHVGLAARFTSGYLIQLKPDQKPLDGPAGASEDFTDLHAWCEVFVPGAGWIGLDPTSGLLTGEGHIPLAATPDPSSAAPISGAVDEAEVEFDFSMSVTRIHEDPRVTLPYTEEQWKRIHILGESVDRRLVADDVRLTMGGEPTFVSIDDMEGDEWNLTAAGETKRALSDDLVRRLRDRFAPQGLLHFGQGKWYPGESLPRWAFACYWRKDGEPIWHDAQLVPALDGPPKNPHGVEQARDFASHLCRRLGIDNDFMVPAYEDAMYYAWKENRLPDNVKAGDSHSGDAEERVRLAQVFNRGLDAPVGMIIPLAEPAPSAATSAQQDPGASWRTGSWPVRAEHLFLIPGDSPMGLRLPLENLSYVPKEQRLQPAPVDPTAPVAPLPAPLLQRWQGEAPSTTHAAAAHGRARHEKWSDSNSSSTRTISASPPSFDPAEVAEVPGQVRTALCVEPRNGRLHVFMPPIDRLEHYLDLVGAVETTAAELRLPVLIEGYPPPHDPRINVLKVTPDPGVIEVNVHPAASWNTLVENTTTLYEAARETRLGTEKFDLDGMHTGTGGGNHLVLGGETPLDSPFLRRPALLASLLKYWINHPALSYVFSGRFIGPTSQAPRVDEGRPDALYELDIALKTLENATDEVAPWVVDRVFRHLLTDLTGNTHRAEICIDKLYSPDSSAGRLGLVELRGFEMPPHLQMNLAQQLLIRSLVAHFWRNPYSADPVSWGTSLHDKFMLPHFLWEDMSDVLRDLQGDDIGFDLSWLEPHFEFRFPRIGEFQFQSVQVELRHALEPWYVLGEEPSGGGTVRAVDSSVERLQIKVQGLTPGRYQIGCGGCRLPLHPTGVEGEFVAGVRYRAWQPPHCLHPTIPVHSPVTVDLVDTWQQRVVAGGNYHVSNPTGSNDDRFPVNALEAESRRGARFFAFGHTPGGVTLEDRGVNRRFPMTLDLRWPGA